MNSKHIVTLTAVLLLSLPLSALASVRYKVLHNFGAKGDGYIPSGPLILDGGNLYGVTTAGGAGCNGYGCGTVFELTPLTNAKYKEAILHKFTYHDGGPWGGLARDGLGNFYGTTLGSGVFELTPASGGWVYSSLYDDGAGPGLLMDDVGNLYGEMGPGKTNFYGAIGELSPGSNGWNYTELYSFCLTYCPDGYSPPTPPIWDGKGNMFGTTTYGGFYSQRCLPYYTRGCGVIYEMTPNGDGTWTYHALHRFLQSSTVDGRNPYSGLVMDKAGNIYGGTWAGGATI
jgi:hypothetical protein